MSILEFDALGVGRIAGPDALIDDVSLLIGRGEIVGVVGESGAGKTTLGLAALGFVRAGTDVTSGQVRVDGTPLFAPGASSGVRGRRISFVSQHPSSALNPALRVRTQLSAMLAAHGIDRGSDDTDDPIREVLRAVSLPDAPELLDRYPHQLSGGQTRRVAMAVALVCRPDVVVLDEPTSGLDPVTGSRVLTTVRSLSTERGIGIMCISHDLAVVGAVADRIVVLYAGHVVEEGPATEVLANPAHPYTRHLVAAVAGVDGRRATGLRGTAPVPTERIGACRFASRCDLARDDCRRSVPVLVDVGRARRARCIDPFSTPHALRSEVTAPVDRPRREDVALTLRDVSATHHDAQAVQSVSFEVMRGEWLAIVGESGSGKTTLVRAIVGSHAERRGLIAFGGELLAASARRRTRAQRRRIRLIPQHPYESFNPRRTIGDSVVRPLVLDGVRRGAARRSVAEALELVSLDPGFAGRYPDELSGGELQRAAIARALVGRPQLLLCDEITASLDSLTQAAVVELLGRLHVELDLTVVFVTHDLGLVRSSSDRTAVMAGGRLVELGPTSTVLSEPSSAAARALLEHRRVLPG